MKIGELADKTGIAASTIRFYEKQGLLPKVPRSNGGYRVYDDNIKARLDCIRLGQKLGFSLQELPKLLSHDNNLDHELIMQRLTEKQQELNKMMQQLAIQTQQIEALRQHLQSVWNTGACVPASEIAELLAKAET